MGTFPTVVVSNATALAWATHYLSNSSYDRLSSFFIWSVIRTAILTVIKVPMRRQYPIQFLPRVLYSLLYVIPLSTLYRKAMGGAIIMPKSYNAYKLVLVLAQNIHFWSDLQISQWPRLYEPSYRSFLILIMPASVQNDPLGCLYLWAYASLHRDKSSNEPALGEDKGYQVLEVYPTIKEVAAGHAPA